MVKYAIIEDNPFALTNLQRMIEKLRPEWRASFSASTIDETISHIDDTGLPDVFFMDIELSDGQCFAIFEKYEIKTPVIFTTAYDEFAIKAFKVNVVDYLLKPITEATLENTIKRFEDLWMKDATSYFDRVTPPQINKQNAKRILTVCGDKYNFINTSDISFFVSEDNYIFAYLKNDSNRRMININNLTELENILPPEDFFRISRNVIASIESISSVSKFFRGRLLVSISSASSSQEISVSSSRRALFLRWLGC